MIILDQNRISLIVVRSKKKLLEKIKKAGSIYLYFYFIEKLEE